MLISHRLQQTPTLRASAALLFLLASIWLLAWKGSSPRDWQARAATILAAAAIVWSAEHIHETEPTEIDGAWRVTTIDPAIRRFDAPALIFFEKNRAHLCVYKLRNGTYSPHHFETDSATRSITIWTRWQDRDRTLFTGYYDLSGNALRLAGKLGDNISEIEMRLERAPLK